MLSLVIDIQSDVIEGSLVKVPGPKDLVTDAFQTLYATGVKVPRKTHTTGDYVTKVMLKGIEDLCAILVKEVPKVSAEPIHDIQYILSTPWVISRSKTVEITYEKDTEITEEIIKQIINADRQKLVETYEDDMIFVEQKIFQVELNGYAVQNYKGKKARTLRVSFAFTLSSDKIVKKIEAAVSKSIYIRKEYYHSAVLLQYLSSRTLVPEGQDFTVLHVHGELTDVVVIKKAFTSYLATFPFGASTLTRKVALSMKQTYEHTGSLLSMYVEGKLEDTAQAKVERALIPIQKGWFAECMKSLQGIGSGIALPHLVHLHMDSPLMPLFKKTLEEKFEVITHEGSLREKHIAALKDVI